MTQLLHPVPACKPEPMLCCYVNGTTQMLIARLIDDANCEFERVVFPKERFLFKALPTSHLEIHRNAWTELTVFDRIPCHYLRIREENSTTWASDFNKITDAERVSLGKTA